SRMSKWTRSPALTGRVSMVTPGAGMSSHHAEYEALPLASTSCSVPAWMRVLSVIRQVASTQPPPMPIQVEEYSASPLLCWVAVGTTQSPETWWNSVPPFSMVPWLYPDQLFDWLAPTLTMGRWETTTPATPAGAAPSRVARLRTAANKGILTGTRAPPG